MEEDSPKLEPPIEVSDLCTSATHSKNPTWLSLMAPFDSIVSKTSYRVFSGNFLKDIPTVK